MLWTYHDGGRRAAGFAGSADDCVTRAIAIATGLPYADVYSELFARMKAFGASGRSRAAKRAARQPSPGTGVYRKVYEPFLAELGWLWLPTMAIGSGCQVHLADGELPEHGPLIARLSKHVCAVVDGHICDTSDPSRGGTRCVYGYFEPGANAIYGTG